MNLREIRQKFVQLTGRRDLVNEATENGNTYYEDNGSDFFIRAGLRYLDRITDLNGQREDIKMYLPSGEFVVPIGRVTHVKEGGDVAGKGFRVVESVRVVRDNDEAQFLRRITFQDFKRKRQRSENQQGSVPSVYTLAEPIQAVKDVGKKGHRELMVWPPAPSDSTVPLGIRGLLTSATLKDDDDRNWWTINMPETLIQAGWYTLERFYRNRTGMKDHRRAILDDIQNFKADEYQEEAVSSDQMNNSEL